MVAVDQCERQLGAPAFHSFKELAGVIRMEGNVAGEGCRPIPENLSYVFGPIGVHRMDHPVAVCVKRARKCLCCRPLEHADLDDVLGSQIAHEDMEQRLCLDRQQRPSRGGMPGKIVDGVAIAWVFKDERERVVASCEIDDRYRNIGQPRRREGAAAVGATAANSRPSSRSSACSADCGSPARIRACVDSRS